MNLNESTSGVFSLEKASYAFLSGFTSGTGGGTTTGSGRGRAGTGGGKMGPDCTTGSGMGLSSEIDSGSGIGAGLGCCGPAALSGFCMGSCLLPR